MMRARGQPGPRRTPDIPRKCLIPTTGFLSRCHLVKFVWMVLGLPKIFEILSGWWIWVFFGPDLSGLAYQVPKNRQSGYSPAKYPLGRQ